MPQVLLFTTSTCPKCEPIKEFLNDNDIPYTEMVYDIDENAKALADELNIMTVPQIVERTILDGGKDKKYIYKDKIYTPSQYKLLWTDNYIPDAYDEPASTSGNDENPNDDEEE